MQVPFLVYRIYPAVGIARVGDSDQYYLAPEKLSDLHENPQEYSQPPQSGRVYRDNTGGKGKILRQAARFRIFEFLYIGATATVPSSVKEVTSAEWDIRWKVELANKKSFTPDPGSSGRTATNRILDTATSGTLDPGATGPVKIDRTVSLPGATPKEVTLATLHPDPDGSGRLIVVPGSGQRGHIYTTETEARSNLMLNSPGWWDDLGDGPVTAEIREKGTSAEFRPVGAWLVLAAPAYAGPVRHVISLYDYVFAMQRDRELALKAFPRGRSSPHTFSFRDDIHPVLHRASLASWVSNEARLIHGPGQFADFTDASRLVRLGTKTDPPNPERKVILDRIKLPLAQMKPKPDRILKMPPPGMATITSFQLRAFEAWVTDPAFAFDWNSQPQPTAPIDVPAEITRCHLSLVAGGPFVPGGEIGNDASQASNWPLIPAPGMMNAGWDDAFRFDPAQPAGTLTFTSPVPWQVDLFKECIYSDPSFFPDGAQPIWPGYRPLEVVDPSNALHPWGLKLPLGAVDAVEAVTRWQDFGFLRKVVSGGTVRYVDDERDVSKVPYP